MNRRSFSLMLIYLIGIYSQSLMAKNIGRSIHPTKTVLEAIEWEGVLRCSSSLSSSHDFCVLEFVKEGGSEVWQVDRYNSSLELPNKLDQPWKVRLKGQRSPRYLLGSQFIRIQSLSSSRHFEESSKEELRAPNYVTANPRNLDRIGRD